ncbi:MAG: 4-hydroxy-3-methylbut-2-enyl diphosphate reductase, partial [Pseudomonadota bacterium]
AAGASYAMLVQTADDIDWRSIEGVKTVGVTAGASAPEHLVQGVVKAFAERYDVSIERVVTAEENVSFKVPRVLRVPA